MSIGLPILFALVVIYGAVAVWLGRRSITMPIIFVAVGAVLGPQGLISAKSLGSEISAT